MTAPIPFKPHAVAPDEPSAEAVVEKTETVAQRVRSLQDELSKLADAEIADLVKALADVKLLAISVAGHDIHKPGRRDLCRRFAETVETFAGQLARMP